MVKGWFSEGSDVGVNRSHSSVRAHGHHVAINDTEAHKGKQEDVYGLGMGMDGFQEMCDELQVTFLRKPGPISATFFQCAGKKWAPPHGRLSFPIPNV